MKDQSDDQQRVYVQSGANVKLAIILGLVAFAIYLGFIVLSIL